MISRKTKPFIVWYTPYFEVSQPFQSKEALDRLGDFKIGGQIIQTLKYADDLVLLAKEEKVLQDMIDKLIEIGRYGMEMNVEKTKVMRISRQPFPVKIIIDQKQLENVESFKYLGSILTFKGLMLDISNAACTPQWPNVIYI